MHWIHEWGIPIEACVLPCKYMMWYEGATRCIMWWIRYGRFPTVIMAFCITWDISNFLRKTYSSRLLLIIDVTGPENPICYVVFFEVPSLQPMPHDEEQILARVAVWSHTVSAMYLTERLGTSYGRSAEFWTALAFGFIFDTIATSSVVLILY